MLARPSLPGGSCAAPPGERELDGDQRDAVLLDQPGFDALAAHDLLDLQRRAAVAPTSRTRRSAEAEACPAGRRSQREPGGAFGVAIHVWAFLTSTCLRWPTDSPFLRPDASACPSRSAERPGIRAPTRLKSSRLTACDAARNGLEVGDRAAERHRLAVAAARASSGCRTRTRGAPRESTWRGPAPPA